MKLLNFKHLSQVEETYWQHLRFAGWAGFYLVYLGIVSIVHGIVPWLCARYPDQLFRDFLIKSQSRMNQVNDTLQKKNLE